MHSHPTVGARLRPESARLHRLVSSMPAAGALLPRVADPRPAQPTLPLDELPDPAPPLGGADHHVRELAAALTTSLIEVIAGIRPAPQLGGWVSPEVFALVDRLAKSGQGAGLRIKSLRVQTPNAVVIEVAAHLQQRGRSKAAALRLHKRAGRWQATELEIALQDHQTSQGREAA
jgi:hypothetical protein